MSDSVTDGKSNKRESSCRGKTEQKRNKTTNAIEGEEQRERNEPACSLVSLS